MFVTIFEVAYKVFDTFYDKKTGKVIWAPIFYLNYHEIEKLKLYKKKDNQWDYLLFDRYY